MKEFSVSTNIYFGEGSLSRLNEVKNKKVFVVCDKFIASSGLISRVLEKLVNCEITIFNDVVPDPSVEIIASGIQKLKTCGARTIIAIGGGSSIDAAKAIREYAKKILGSDFEVEECFAIPTTSGTGSEATQYAVITDKEEELKYALSDKALLPMVAILDPELVISVPSNITADTGMDVITHAIEAYVSKNANDFSDALAEKAISLVFKFLPIAFMDGNNLLAREKIHNASCLAGMAFNSAGLGVTHSLAHAIGGKLHISHGRSNAIILPHVIEYNANLNKDNYNKVYDLAARKYQRLAKILNLHASTVSIGVNNLIKCVIDLQKMLMIPSTLKGQGVEIDLLSETKEKIIAAAMNDICTVTNPRKVLEQDLLMILEKIKDFR